MPSAVEAEGKTLNLNIKKAVVNNVHKQLKQTKTDLPTLKSMLGSDTECLKTDKAHWQTKITKAFLKKVDLKKTLNSGVVVKKAGSEKNQTGKHSETTPSNSF